MVFYAGVILIAVSLFMIFRLVRNSKRPKLKARIEEIILQYVKNDTQKVKKHKHARASFFHEGKTYEDMVLLKRKSAKQGDTIELSYKITDITKIEHYEPKPEIIAIIIIFAIGVAIIGFCLFVIDYFGLWN